MRLADAGRQVWELLFHAPRADAGLQRLADALRAVPHGSRFQVVLGSQQLIVPWALLYDAPGPLTAETLDWSGFWDYRYILDAFPPKWYPAPVIADRAPGLLMLLNDDENLRAFTAAQEQFMRQTFAKVEVERNPMVIVG